MLHDWMVGGIGEYKSVRGGDLARWLEMYDGGQLIVDRKSTDAPQVFVPRAVVSITGGIQQDTFLDAFQREHFDSGLTARFLLTMPPSGVAGWTEDELSDETRADYRRLFDGLFEARLEPGQHAELPLDGKAKQVWIEYVNEVAELEVSAEGATRAAWAKLKGVGARLALVTHMIRGVSSDPTLRDARVIDQLSVSMAVVAARWFRQETQRIYGVLSEKEDQRERRRLVDCIGRHGGEITPTELRRSSRRYRSTDLATAALERLAASGCGGWMERPTGPSGGRPTRSFILDGRLRNPLDEPEPVSRGEGFVGFVDGAEDGGSDRRDTLARARGEA